MKLTKYLFILVLVNVIGVVMFFIVHSVFLNKINKMNDDFHNLQVKQYIALDIDQSILKLQSLFMKLPLLSSNVMPMNRINEQIKNEILHIRKILYILKNGGIYEKKVDLNVKGIDFLHQKFKFYKPEISIEDIDISPKLTLLEKKLADLNELVKKRNNHFYVKDTDFFNINIEIRRYVKALPSIFSRMIENSNRTVYITDIELQSLKKELNNKLELYNEIELIFIALVIIVVMSIVYIVIKNILTLYQELEYRLYYDHLTGLKNRISLEENTKNSDGSLLLIDIDSFNNVNELYGTDIGNEVLVRFSENLSKILEGRDVTLYRVSGDVFALYFTEVIDIKSFTSRLREEIVDNSLFISSINTVLELDIKIGAAVGEELLEKATVALDYAKKNNLQCYKLSEKSLSNKENIEFAIKWQKNIRNGLHQDKFLPFFQSIADKDKNIIKYEALMRLESYEDGETKYIPPLYLDIAIKNRQYMALSKTIIEKAFDYFTTRSDEVSINLSYLDIKNLEMNSFIFNLLEKYKDIGHRITFEILEDENIESYEVIKKFITKLKSYGVKLAIDDFGSGYSNFQRILELEPDYIKIDGTLIKDIDVNRASYVIVESIVHYAKKFEIKTIAEFVHSKEVFDVCIEIGIDYFQGYYIDKPQKDI